MGEERLEQFAGPSRRLDILVNNAGVLTTGAFEDVPLKAHRQMVDINFYGALAGLHAAFPYLRDTPRAQVVNMCSASAIYGQPELATYSATKFALRALTEALELEWRRHGIRVLAMWPLFVQTAMTDGVETGSTKSLGVHLKPEDVAEAVYSATHRGRARLPKVHYPVGRQTVFLRSVAGDTRLGAAIAHQDGDPQLAEQAHGRFGGCWFWMNDWRTGRGDRRCR